MINEADVRDAIKGVAGSDTAMQIPVEETFADAGIDSLDHTNILLRLQERHNLVVPDEALDECSSINGILAFAQRQEDATGGG